MSTFRMPLRRIPCALALSLAFMSPVVFADDAPTDPVLAEFQRLKTQYEAEKLMHEAKSAAIQAELAAAKAKFGDFQPAFTGAVTAEANAASGEAQLLAVKAMNDLASLYAEALAKKTPLKPVVLVTEAPDFGALMTYQSRIEGLKNVASSLPPAGAPKVVTASVAGTMVALQAANALLGFVRNDYAFKSVEVKASDSTWLAILGGALVKNGIKVRQPHLYMPQTLYTDAESQLSILVKWVNDAASAIKYFDEQIAEVSARIKVHEAKIAKLKGNALAQEKKALEGAMAAKAKLEADKARHVQFQTAAAAMVTELTTPAADGKVVLAEILRQRALRDQIEGLPGSTGNRQLVVTKIDHVAGNSYTKKGIFSGIFGVPLYVMGGASASITAYDKEGDIVFSEALPIHGGYHKVSAVPEQLRASTGATLAVQAAPAAATQQPGAATPPGGQEKAAGAP